MTCIVALKQRDHVYMAGDSASVSTEQLFSQKIQDPKIFQNGPYLIGYTSSFRMGQLLQHKIDLPTPKGDLVRFMCTDFIDDIRRLFKNNGYSKVDNNEESGGTFIVAIDGEIFVIQGDYQVARYAQPFAAIGCGREYALAVLYTLYGEEEPEVVLRKALKASTEFCIGVREPFHFLKV